MCGCRAEQVIIAQYFSMCCIFYPASVMVRKQGLLTSGNAVDRHQKDKTAPKWIIYVIFKGSGDKVFAQIICLL